MELSWSSVGKAVASVAPTLAGALGGPVGAVAGAAGSLICQALGVDSAEQAELALKSSPDALLRMKELEVREKERLLAWQEVQLSADLENVKSAREREVEVVKSGSAVGWSTTVVSILAISVFAVMAWLVLVSGAAVDNAAYILLGTAASGYGAVLNYYLGSSNGSAIKDSFIRNGGKK